MPTLKTESKYSLIMDNHRHHRHYYHLKERIMNKWMHTPMCTETTPTYFHIRDIDDAKMMLMLTEPSSLDELYFVMRISSTLTISWILYKNVKSKNTFVRTSDEKYWNGNYVGRVCRWTNVCYINIIYVHAQHI